MTWYSAADLPKLNELLPASLAKELDVLIISSDDSQLTLACTNELDHESRKRVEFVMQKPISWKELPKQEIKKGLKFVHSESHKNESAGHEILQEFEKEKSNRQENGQIKGDIGK